MPRVAIYVRVSTDAQSETGSSLDTQQAACRQYATERDYTVVTVESETWTGAQYRERPGLSRVRELIRSGAVDVLLCHAIDRLSRNQAHLAILIQECQDHKVAPEFVTEDFADTAVGRFIMAAKGFAAEIEREKISERVIRGKLARLHSGRMMVPPRPLYGYAPNTDRSGYVIDPDHAPIVARIFHDVLTGKPLRQVALALYQDGIASPSGRERWGLSTLSNILSHPAYTGTAYAWAWRGNGNVFDASSAILLPDGTIPAIVSREAWESVQVRLRRNREQAARNNHEPHATLLRGGFARCGYCDRAMTVHRVSSGFLSYRCGGHSSAYRCQEHPRIGADKLDRIVWQWMCDSIANPETLIAPLTDAFDTPDATDSLSQLDRQIAALSRKQANLIRQLASFDDPLLTTGIRAEMEAIASRRRDLGTRRDTATNTQEARSAAERQHDDLRDRCAAYAPQIAAFGVADRRRVLDDFGVSVQVWRSEHRPRYRITPRHE